MSQNAVPAVSKRKMTTRTLAYCAMLSALQVVLARLIIPMPAADTRFSLEAIPVVLAGILFGPVPGAMVGFGSDLVGCLFSGYGYNPLFCLPPILYGLFGGFFRYYVNSKPNFWRVLLTYVPPVVLGSILWQSFTLAYVYNSQGAFLQSLILKLSTRSVQFVIAGTLEALVTYILLKSGIFKALKVWPLAAKAKK